MSLHKHAGGCHCGNIRVVVELKRSAADSPLRACGCSFCRAHGTRTVADPDGVFKVWAEDWREVLRYKFGTGTADYLMCRSCGVYVGAVCETSSGLRAVANVNCLNDRAQFTAVPAPMDFDGETTETRLARRATNWMPAVVHS